MRLARASGVLLHPTSLPGTDGIGDLGPAARRFIDFLAAARQHVWQVLPLGPPGPGESPYAATSAFAGSPMLLSLEDLRLGRGSSRQRRGRVDYERVRREKGTRLRRAWEAFRARPDHLTKLEELGAENPWLADFVLFAALKEAHGGAGWIEWPKPLANRDASALRAFHESHRDDLGFHAFLQLRFAEQWQALKAYAAERDVRIMGDVPIFVAHDSADVWARRDLFRLADEGQPTVVAGVPPDYFSATGQLWGNPLYRWERMAADGYAWWVDRFRHLFRMVDSVRIDHFRGFVAHWSVAAGEPTAVGGRWESAPGRAIFDAVRRAVGDLAIVAEDLGTITPDVIALRDAFGFPGMRVLQFAFGDTPANPYLPHNYEPNCVVYTGTHDNDTTVGWFHALGEAERARVCLYTGGDGRDPAWELIQLALSSTADTAMVPLQDVFGLGPEARMNTPGTANGNWTWRFAADDLNPQLAERFAELVARYNRLGPSPSAGLVS